MTVPIDTHSPARRFDYISETYNNGLLILSPTHMRVKRRVLHVNSYGGSYVWNRIKAGALPTHQFLGCVELVKLGYEVALAEPLGDFYLHRRPLPHDFRLLNVSRSWLGPDGIVFCGHNVLYWLPILKRLGLLRCRVVSLLYAKEPLNVASAHTGILSLTPAGAAQAKRLAPKAKIANLGWGVDLEFFRFQKYTPTYFLSCGIANRDFATLRAAAKLYSGPIRVVFPGAENQALWPNTVEIVNGGNGWLTDKTKKVSVADLIERHYPGSSGTLIIMKNDPVEYTANGFTNLIEAMALGQPVIVTRTGALPGELDVEKSGCGLHVPANDPDALSVAMRTLELDSSLAEAMGLKGRELVERYYNMNRYANDLDAFFDTL